MKIIIYADLHERDVSFVSYQPDAVFLLGDIYYKDVEQIDAYYTCPKFGVLGNHDRLDYLEGTSIRHVGNPHKGVFNVSALGDYSIIGCDGSPRYNQKENVAQYKEDEIYSYLAEFSMPIDLFVAHSNASSEMLFDEKDAHRGFYPFYEFICKKQPRYFFHGHIHENKIYTIGNTTVVSTFGMREIEI